MVLVSVLLPKSTATPANRQYYVAVTGSDSNDGSSARPWKTIQHAADLALPGWTIHILAGTYSISTTVTTSNSGTPGSTCRTIFPFHSTLAAAVEQRSLQTALPRPPASPPQHLALLTARQSASMPPHEDTGLLRPAEVPQASSGQAQLYSIGHQ